jgi:hypothetical protein
MKRQMANGWNSFDATLFLDVEDIKALFPPLCSAVVSATTVQPMLILSM